MNNDVQANEIESSKQELQEIRLLCEGLKLEDNTLTKELDILERRLKKQEGTNIFEKKIEEFCSKVEELKSFECETGKQEELKEKLKILDKEIEEIEGSELIKEAENLMETVKYTKKIICSLKP